MKVQSKKDQYAVICENSKQTCDVLNYVDHNSDRTWSHWEYVTRIGDDDSDINESNSYEYPVISFEEWQSLPDIPNPEYDPKDVAFKNDFYSKSEFNSEKKVIGYKLIKPEYKEAFCKIMDVDEDFIYISDEEPFHFTKKSDSAETLKLLDILDIWCEPVFSTSITLKSGVTLSEDDIAEVTKLIEMRGICKALSNENQVKEILKNK